MASQVEIVNLALNALGESDFILAMNENTKSARLANLIWESSKRKVLEDHTWKFATKRINLSPLVATPAYEYDYQYQVPSDFIRIVEVSDSNEPLEDYETNESMILCNESIIYLKYIYDITNTELFTAGFANCFSIYLAHKMAYNITGNRSKESDLLQIYIQELRNAKDNDAASSTPKQPIANDLWTKTVRLGGSQSVGYGGYF